MAKKKNSPKKHKFKYAEVSAGPSEASPREQLPREQVSGSQTLREQAALGGTSAQKAKLATVNAVGARDFGYVMQDLRHIGLLAAALIAFELLLWYALANTGLGDLVYRLVQV